MAEDKKSGLVSRLIKKLQSTPRRRYIEVFGVALLLFVILGVSTLLTPYSPPASQRDALFYADGGNYSDNVVYYRAEVSAIDNDQMRIILEDGMLSGVEQPLEGPVASLRERLEVGDTIVVAQRTDASEYVFLDHVRIVGLAVILAVFVGLVLLIGRKRGVTSIVGLGVSILVIGWLIVPMILAEYSAFWVIVLGAFIIATTSLFIAHGLRLRTVISVLCVLLLLALVCLFSYFAVWLVGLTGVSSETAYYLQLQNSEIDIRGILIGGIIIASLGVLDDIVTAQVAVVDELHQAKPSSTVAELVRGANSVGGEHIAALVNTLALAYVGASLPVIISMASVESSSLFLIINSEYIATEIVRTLVASSALVLAVPLSTYAATVSYKFIIPRMVQLKHE